MFLQNYRVYEEPVELEMPPGLVGIYGINGAGKSTLVESVRWAIWGKSRTTIDQVRTSGVNADCIVELEFEHEGHLYAVRRTITGVNHTVKAQAHADRLQVCEGVKDTAKYLRSILGMDDAAFRASVFAEQKQLAAFSNQSPADRRRLVLQLLGVTPLDGARDQARKDARATADTFERARATLPDLGVLAAAATAAAGAAEVAEREAHALAAAATHAGAEAATAHDAFAAADLVRQEHEQLVAAGKAARATHDSIATRITEIERELVALGEAAEELRRLQPDADGLAAAEARLHAVQRVLEAEAALARVELPAEPPAFDDRVLDDARVASEATAGAVSELDGRLRGARDSLVRARDALERSASLSGESACPVCGQELGGAFEQVQAHRATEVAELLGVIAALDVERTTAVAAAQDARQLVERRTAEARSAAEARRAHAEAWARHNAAAEAAALAVEALGGVPVRDGEGAALATEVSHRRETAKECTRLGARLERQPVLERELVTHRERLVLAAGELEELRTKVRELGHDADRLAAAVAERNRTRAVADDVARRAQLAQVEATRAVTQSAAAAATQRSAEEQHAKLAGLADDARHLRRLAELLGAFRDTIVTTAGPRLSAQAADLFAELTDREYERLEVDPETYEIQIRDAGVVYGMDRFSGSEIDLANLALRVAISEQVRFQSGGAVGLLVLDEVFGPLDDDRKARMLLALERLRGRFRQVLVVTHADDVKDQLPNAIEVVKLPGRRATARLLTA
jgi:exonuclease SbcC